MAKPTEYRVLTLEDDGNPPVVTTYSNDKLEPFQRLSDLSLSSSAVVPSSDTRGAAVPADPASASVEHAASANSVPLGRGSRFVAGGHEVPFGYEDKLLRVLSVPRRRPPSRRPRGALACGRPARRGTTRSARAGPSDPDDPEPAGPGDPVGDTSRTRYSLRREATA